MKKLESHEDIEHLINSFYAKVVKDEVIGFFFNDVAKVDWDKHLPKCMPSGSPCSSGR